MAKKSQLGKTGLIGEQLAKRFLLNEGYEVISENVTYVFGEIDLVAKRSDTYYFVEVKAADVNSSMLVSLSERLYPRKLERFKKSVQTYIAANNLYQYEINLCAILIKINHETKKSRLKFIKNLI
jgi:putative endonuclease